MSKATAATSIMSYVAEVTPGTTPATPAFNKTRASNETLKAVRKISYGSELNGNRGQMNSAIDASQGTGGFDMPLSYATLEDFLEAALCGTWAADVLVDAKTGKSFTFETKFETGATDVYKRLAGAYVEEFSFSLKAGQRSTAKVALKAMTGEFANAAIAGATYAEGNSNPILVGADVGNLALAGLTFDHLAGLDLTIKNSLAEQWALGSLTPVGMGLGALEVTGKIDLFVDSTMYNVVRAALDGTLTGLTARVGRTAGSRYTFELPNLRLEEPDSNVQAGSGDNVMLSLNFRALQDFSTLSGSVIRVTRAV